MADVMSIRQPVANGRPNKKRKTIHKKRNNLFITLNKNHYIRKDIVLKDLLFVTTADAKVVLTFGSRDDIEIPADDNDAARRISKSIISSIEKLAAQTVELNETDIQKHIDEELNSESSTEKSHSDSE